ncbi:dicarboxylate/amino acid:cation symporter [Anaerosphaera multitolerans]|uniref:Dicarboxylate/amino acid:cation symporter n=1 Tax=Anaerosphaera multitolerans TaxID=2487351 RepID=A0A437S4E0_9FIRM|nr:dicarboxylate/amino acid:cation symporter [Anaerosphaera multitolerans]RVU53905.1 dicarboxylate/amino acid:cation symporter [Anaerosphaera multitolerans]
MGEVTKKKEIPSYVKIFIGLFLGIVFGYILNLLGGTSVPMINDHILPFLQFLGDFFIKLIKMVVVPLVFFSITNAAISLKDISKLRSVGVKTIVWFLMSSGLACGIGLILANIIKPGIGVDFGSVSAEAVQVQELPGVYTVILDLIPNNPVESLANGEMMQVIVFALFLGFSLIALGEKAEPLNRIITICSDAMFYIIGVIIKIIPFGVFGLMSVAIAKFGTAIFGPVLKFIITDYLSCLIMLIIIYSIFLRFVAGVNPIPFYKKAFEPWMIAFSTCTSSAALPVSMEVGPRLGVPRDISDFVLPFGATANMNGTCIYFGVIVVFASQLYGIELSIQQQILLVVQATFLSVGCAATPQIGLVISITLLTQMGLPLEATALVAGVYRIVDQIHTSTNSAGDLVTSVVVAKMEGELDKEVYYDMSLK